jgi:hypothetical protein
LKLGTEWEGEEKEGSRRKENRRRTEGLTTLIN